MDDADRAKELEMAHRAAALEHHRAQAAEDGGEPYIIDGYRACISCHAPIPVARLKAVPGARYCTDCQAIKERRR